jgi:hypothetical protein
MPNYVFKNKETGEISEHFMSYTKLDEFKEQNPQLERFFSVNDLPVFSDGMRMNVPGISRGDPAFEHGVIDRIKESVPGNTLKQNHKTVGNKWI